MKKVFFGLVLLLSLASCGPGTDTKKSSDSQETTTSSGGSSATMPDTTVTPNQSGSTGNGGVGTGAVNGTGEESSPANKPQQK